MFSILASLVTSDIYMHYPRGSNDRCDEASNDRNNDNRLFDSQNNAAGGYNTCMKEMTYYENTDLSIEWTSQHGCGNGRNSKNDPLNQEKDRCEFILQMGCEDGFGMDAGLFPISGYNLTDGESPIPASQADGTGSCTQTKPIPETCTAANNAPTCATLDLSKTADRATFNSATCSCSPRKLLTYGMHESPLYYSKCATRNRNKNLYVAKNIDPADTTRTTAIFTRQNQNGNRNGFECAEERDYYPYWHYTPWRDVAILTSDTTLCPMFQSQSQNVLGRGECVNANDPSDKTFWMYNNQNDCTTTTGGQPRANAQWVSTPAWNIPQPDCIQAPYLKDNHLGQAAPSISDNTGTPAGELQTYKWNIPTGFVPSGRDSLRCTLRVRYNISTAEMQRSYTAANNGVIGNRPLVNAGVFENGADTDPSVVLPLKITLNTNQNARTFEDRSYVFTVKKRPDELKNKNIINVNVRGKRGNIAQVRNCVEYDFVPSKLSVNNGDLIHFQWCGSDYNDKNNDGQGIPGTDRSNFVPVSNLMGNVVQPVQSAGLFSTDDLKKLAWINQTDCYSVAEIVNQNANTNDNTVQQDPKSCQYLNGATTPYYSQMVEVQSTGTQCFVGTRNNNFSNRSQKMCITAQQSVASQVATTVGIVVGVILFIVLVVVVGIFVRRRYGSGFVLLDRFNPYPKRV